MKLDLFFTYFGGKWRIAKHYPIVCEQDGASWLDFNPFREVKALEGKKGKRTSKEVIWTKEEFTCL